MVEYRYLGNSGLKITEITYGNWVTHGLQVDRDKAIATVHRALDLGITSFDTADVYANTGAEKILGKALKGIPGRTWRFSPRCTGRLATRARTTRGCHASTFLTGSTVHYAA